MPNPILLFYYLTFIDYWIYYKIFIFMQQTQIHVQIIALGSAEGQKI